ncbi:XRE family transcriptional regulator [Salmonella enterica]|nr:XRE family transcriptional regulator [Salmonella enterica]
MNNKFSVSPEEVKRLRKKIGLTQKQTAELFGIGIFSWQRKEIPITSKNNRPLTKAEYIVLQLLADEYAGYSVKTETH